MLFFLWFIFIYFKNCCCNNCNIIIIFVTRPNEILINNNKVEIVSNFKLLGVIIDEKLSFDKYTCDVRTTIMKKMYSIKKLFQLSHTVKIQFFKTFIIPHFFYCSTLTIYFSKSSVQRLAKVLGGVQGATFWVYEIP